MEEPTPPDPLEQLIVGLVPVVGQPLADFRRDRYTLEMHRARVVAEEVAAATGWSPAELLEQVASDERLGDVLVRTIEAARRSGVEAKLRALGRAVASGALAADDAEVDIAELLVRTLDDLEAAEIRALLAYESTTMNRTREWFPRGDDAGDPVARAVDASLERHGLIEVLAHAREKSYHLGGPQIDEQRRLTAFGRRLLDLLQSIDT